MDEICKRFPDTEGEHADQYGATDHPIEMGMTMAVETMEPAERQGVRVEGMVVVRENGVEIFSEWPVEEITRIDC